jgi:rare lipoprotein A
VQDNLLNAICQLTEQIELMNQKFWSGITTTAIVTVFGTTAFLASSQIDVAASEADSASKEQLAETETTQPHANELAKSLSHLETTTEENAIATIFPHQWKDSPAVTLRIRDIPVLTFLGSPVKPENPTQATETRKSAQSPNNLLLRAKAVASRLNQLSQNNLDARKITVSWKSESQSYSIKVQDEELATIDDSTILPDTTDNPAIDALQATNRLRRLMGDAPPLTEIAGQPKPKPGKTLAMQVGVKQMRGMASWYGPGFHGRQTANGERFNQHSLTAAHRSLPFGTKVRVTNANNGRSVVVRINDRGPFVGGRSIDLSAAAARAIGMSGVAPVRIEILGR